MTSPVKHILLIFLTLVFLWANLTAKANRDRNLQTDSNETGVISSGRFIELTEEEREFLTDLEPLQVLVDDNFSPISFYNEELKEFSGISVEVLKILSKTLSFKYEIIRDAKLNWSDKLEEIKNNKVHILGGASRNAQRQEYGYFTDYEYFTISYALVGSIYNHVYLTDISQINKFTIGLIDGSTINNYILEHVNDNSKIKYYKRKEDLFAALNRNEVDIIPRNEATFYEDFFTGDFFDFEVVFSIHEVQKEYAFFCPKTNEGKLLTEILDKGMKEININKLISRHYNNKSIYSFYKEYTDQLQQNIIKRNILLIIIITFLAAAFIIMIIIKKQAGQKEHLIHNLEKALIEVKTLSGLLPICSNCKKVRDEKGYWKQIESYIESNTDAQFSHGLCETCAKEIFGDKDWFENKKKK